MTNEREPAMNGQRIRHLLERLTLLFVLAVIIICIVGAIAAVTGNLPGQAERHAERAACEKAGDVWLNRDHVCISRSVVRP